MAFAAVFAAAEAPLRPQGVVERRTDAGEGEVVGIFVQKELLPHEEVQRLALHALKMVVVVMGVAESHCS